MTELQLVCASCKKRVTNIKGTTRFPCPNCAKTTIIRCSNCRETAAKYKCSNCGFSGPN